MNMHLEKFATELKSYLARYFVEHDYRLLDDMNVTFKCEQPSFTDFIVVYAGADNLKKKLSTMIHCYRRIELIERLWDEYKNSPLKIENSIPYTLAANMYERMSNGTISENVSRIECPFDKVVIQEIGDGHIKLWKERFKPWLDRYSNVFELNKAVNPSMELSTFPMYHGGLWFYKMIIARLSGDVILEQIYNHLVEIYEKAILNETNEKQRKGYEEELGVTHQLYQKLKNVKPLENPILI